jgi:hypothetical protein
MDVYLVTMAQTGPLVASQSPSGPLSASPKPKPNLTRVAFKVSRLMEFCSERELQNQTGHSIYDWPLVVGKEACAHQCIGEAAKDWARMMWGRLASTPGRHALVKRNFRNYRRNSPPTRPPITRNGPPIPRAW